MTREAREAEALAFGNSPEKVEYRLRQAALLLRHEYKRLFAHAHARYHADTRRLVSADDKWALEWQLRNRPDQPIGYGNAQFGRGKVVLVALGAFTVSPNQEVDLRA